MTEAEWLTCETTNRMYNLACHLGVSDRKLRLIVCAYCRTIWDRLPDEMSRAAVEMGELLADGLVKEGRAKEASWALYRAIEKKRGDSASAAYVDGASVAWLTIVPSAASALATLGSGRHGNNNGAVQAKVASLYRHLIGNPFLAHAAPPSWLQTVIGLAQALYAGDDCRLILADALEETGYQAVAGHFRQEEWHPNGCWVLDFILDKK